MAQKVMRQTAARDAAQAAGEHDILADYRIDAEAMRQAEKLTTLRYTETERAQVLALLPALLEKYEKRRTVELSPAEGPALRFDPRLHESPAELQKKVVVKIRSTGNPRWNYIRQRRGLYRVRPDLGPLPVDQTARALEQTAHRDLSRAAEALRHASFLRHHAHRGARVRDGGPGRS